MNFSKKHPLIAGTILLTIAGLISRFIGFFYRIYLSRTFGEEAMGVYQLIGPVMAVSFALTCAGFQTSISKFVAGQTSAHSDNTLHKSYRPFFLGLSISLPLSIFCMLILQNSTDYIATVILKEPRTAPMITVVSLTIPICSVHACINGYFYGIKKSSIPAFTQLFEQLCRVGFVYFFSVYTLSHNKPLTVHIAILGLAVGEVLSLLASVFALFIHYAKEKTKRVQYTSSYLTYSIFFAMLLPLMANRIVLNILGSMESISLPTSLRSYGYDSATALSIYGVLTGMALPLIYFPNALTGSVSVLLLPHISENHAKGDLPAVRRDTIKTIKYCGLMGFGCCVLFALSGKFIGSSIFHSELAGHFIVTLSFICPFLYMDITLSSIMQGLGMATKLFIINVLALVIRLLFVYWSVPKIGITGYLWGLLAGQIVLCFFYLYFIHKKLTLFYCTKNGNVL